MIRYFRHNDVDRKSWDECINNSATGLPYAHSWYLDIVADRQWDGLVLNNFKAVMPLPWRSKLGIRYVYQPFFCQQLGVFGERQIAREEMDSFLRKAEEHFKFMEVNLNYTNKEVVATEPRTNLILKVTSDVEEIRSNYSSNLKRSIKKALSNHLEILENQSGEQLIQLFRRSKGAVVDELKAVDYERLAKLILESTQRGEGYITGVKNEDGELISAGFFHETEERLINLFPATSEEGKNLGASPFLLDHQIKKLTASKKIMDFEGSMIPGVARFYESFGAVDQPYFPCTINNLPPAIKWLKK